MTERDVAINDVISKVGNRLFDFIESRVPTYEDAEDILQDVLMQFVASFDSIISFERVLGWLYTVSRNKITDMFRKKKPISESEYISKEHGNELQNIIADIAINPEDRYEQMFLENEIENAINALPEKQKEIFILNEIKNKSFREIADSTNESINTLLARKRYAVQSLRKQLIKSYQEILEISK